MEPETEDLRGPEALPKKLCRGPCGELKTIDEFARRKAASDGRQSYCRACFRQKRRGSFARLGVREEPSPLEAFAERWVSLHSAEHPNVPSLAEKAPIGYVPPSPATLAALDAAVGVARTSTPVDLGNFAQYADDE